MITFNTNRNALLSSILTLENDFNAFVCLGVAKGTRNHKRQKTHLIKNISDAVSNTDISIHGIRVIFITTKE